MTITTIDATAVAESYLAAWNEVDATTRAALVQGAWSSDCTYTDPIAEAAGHEAIVGLIGAVQHQFPGCAFRLLGNVDGHHDVLRFRWELVPADGSDAPIVGFDVIELDSDGRIRNVFGFLDKVPSA